MKILTEMKQGVMIIRLEGELDLQGANAFREKVDAALEASGVKQVLLNLEHVAFIDSSGLGVILGRYKRVSTLGGQIAVAHVQPQVARILELSGLLRIMSQYNTEAEALNQL